MLPNMDKITIKPSIALNLLYLQIAGVYPVNTKYNLLNKLHYYWGYIVWGWFSIFIITEFIQMYIIWGDVEDMTTNATVSLLYVLGIGKISILLYQKNRLYRMINIILSTEQSIWDNGPKSVIDIFIKYRNRSRNVTKYFSLMTAFTLMGCFSIPHTELFLSGPSYIKYPNGTLTNIIKKPRIFSSWFPFNDNESPGYEIAFLVHIISGCIGASLSCISNTNNFSMLVFAAGQLQILQNKLANLGRSESIQERQSINVVSGIKNCVSHHNGIIKFVDTLRIWFNPVMFLELLICSIMLCAILYQVTLQDFNVRLFFIVEYLVAMLIVLFVSYWHANEVLVESLKVADSVGYCDWYTFDNTSKQLLRLVIMRSQKALTLTAGPFSKMSLETYLDIVKASFTYLTLLRQVYE